MKIQTLAMIIGAALLAGSAALDSMSVKAAIPDQHAGTPDHGGRSAAPAALSVVVTSRRAMPGRSVSGTRTSPVLPSTGWTFSAPPDRARTDGSAGHGS